MDFLQKFWPMAFSTVKKDVKPFVIRLIIYWVIGFAVGLVAGITIGVVAYFAPNVGTVLGWILSPISYIVGLYCTAGIVFTILRFTGVFKDADAPVAEVEATEVNDEAKND